MNDVPLVNKNDINSINTSIIAIKKQLKQLNEAVGLIDTPDINIDLTPFVKKTDVVDAVQSGNMNPVTSNAVAGIMSTRTILFNGNITTSDVNYTLDNNYNLSDFTYMEVLVYDSSYIRGSISVSLGLFRSPKGVIVPCAYGGNLSTIVLQYVSDTQIKMRTATSAMNGVLIYGYKTNSITQNNINNRGVENFVDSNNRKGEEPIEEPKEEEKK